MRRLLVIFAISILFVSCSNNENLSDQDKLSLYKKQIRELEQQIIDIESENADEEYTGLRIPVRAESVSIQPFSHSFTAAGELESIYEAYISPEVNGQIVSINVKEGSVVNKGQVIAKLNTTIVDKNIVELQSQLELASTIFDKQSQLWEKGIGSERQFLEAKNNFESLQNKIYTLKAQREMAIIKTPINGVVEEIFQKKGELASPGMQLMQIVNLNELYITARLSEAYLSVVKKGDYVDVSFPSYPDLKYRKKIWRTGNVVNKQNRTFVVQVKVDNPDGLLKPNMLANITINDYNSENSVVLPSIIIREDMSGSFIFGIKEENGDNVAVKIYIKTGKSFKDKTEVLEGLEEGDIVITDGYNNVSKGAVVTIIE